MTPRHIRALAVEDARLAAEHDAEEKTRQVMHCVEQAGIEMLPWQRSCLKRLLMDRL